MLQMLATQPPSQIWNKKKIKDAEIEKGKSPEAKDRWNNLRKAG